MSTDNVAKTPLFPQFGGLPKKCIKLYQQRGVQDTVYSKLDRDHVRPSTLSRAIALYFKKPMVEHYPEPVNQSGSPRFQGDQRMFPNTSHLLPFPRIWFGSHRQ